MVYTPSRPNESDNTDVYVRHSDDSGATWSAGDASQRRPHPQQPVPAEDRARSDHRKPRRGLVRLPATTREAAAPATPTDPATTTRSSGAHSAPTAATASGPTFRSAPAPPTRTTPATESTTGTTRACRSRRARPPRLVGQLQQHREQPRRRAAPIGHLHGRVARRRVAPVRDRRRIEGTGGQSRREAHRPIAPRRGQGVADSAPPTHRHEL